MNKNYENIGELNERFNQILEFQEKYNEKIQQIELLVVQVYDQVNKINETLVTLETQIENSREEAQINKHLVLTLLSRVQSLEK